MIEKLRKKVISLYDLGEEDTTLECAEPEGFEFTDNSICISVFVGQKNRVHHFAIDYLLDSVWTMNPRHILKFAKKGIDEFDIRACQKRYEHGNGLLLLMIEDGKGLVPFIEYMLEVEGLGAYLPAEGGLYDEFVIDNIPFISYIIY